MPALRDDLHVFVPVRRGPGKPWTPGPAPAEIPEQRQAGAAIRIGYAGCSTAGQELSSQIDALTRAGCLKIFQEKISTPVKHRPEIAQGAPAGLRRQGRPDPTRRSSSPSMS